MSEPKHVYYVQLLSGRREQDKPFRIIFETPLQSVEQIVDQLQRFGVVCGQNLSTVDDGQGGRLIRRRSGFAFGTIGLLAVQPVDRPVWEPQP